MLEGSSDEAAKEGTALIYNKLMAYLKTRGLEVIEAVGKPFDTDFHEAAAQFPAPEESLKGMVIDVVQTGYTLGGKVLRYAKVVVGA
jgi:molecular chaperone GrpE